jgi:hypothetical protein
MGLVGEDLKDEKENGQRNIDTVNVDAVELKEKSESIKQPVQEPSVNQAANKEDLIVDTTACPQDKLRYRFEFVE